MPFSNLELPDLNRIIADFYTGINPNEVKDNEYLERVQHNCIEQANPFSCYFTLLLGEEPRITWKHNTARLFGIIDLQYTDVFGLVHPAWTYAYVNYARAMYGLAHKYVELSNGEGAAAGSFVPMRHRSGKYYWYHQVSVRVATDGNQMAAHLNYYHQVAAYEGLLPAMPQLVTSGEVNKVIMKELTELALVFLPGFLAQFLPETQIGFMLQYRSFLFENPGEKISQGNWL